MPEEGALFANLKESADVGTDLSKETPNVVTETLFRSLVGNGYQAEVVSRVAAHKKAAVWYGEWIIRVVNQDRTYEKTLVPARKRANAQEDEITVRVFKTANGLISFMQGVGFEHVDIPLVAGGRSIHTLTNNSLDTNGG
ncbi:hypothetical protein [Leisingera sp. M658]|uniref:hypothetical protein n=1 Tax=Leisingera sp. M658 TaxID=2867015 RepID=UPI0021A7C4B0|nr:hypothetical protein [Leisingera sp. M658]UWQ77410.1 hypothetical protein K3724_23050 [Leisingera sp. M658]